MAIQRVWAYKTSTGDLFDDKESAYRREVVHLYDSIPTPDGKSVSGSGLQRLTKRVRAWLEQAEALVDELDQENEA
jgi:hypothetical protein